MSEQTALLETRKSVVVELSLVKYITLSLHRKIYILIDSQQNVYILDAEIKYSFLDNKNMYN